MNSRARAMAVDTGTSLEAALSQTETHTTTVREHIVAILRDGPMTDDAIRAAYEVRVRTHDAPMASPSSLRSRRSELCRSGTVSATRLGARVRIGWRGARR